jgi:multisubunit Na+/H+ antiporter MnhB subunit
MPARHPLHQGKHLARSQISGLGSSESLTWSYQSSISNSDPQKDQSVSRPEDVRGRSLSTFLSKQLRTLLTAIAVGLILIGFFSPWVTHNTAGLAMTGFEIGEWIKFVPEMRGEPPPLRRTDFYWSPIAAAAGLAVLAADRTRWVLRNWLLVLLACVFSLFPFPLLEELQGLGGISASVGRLVLTGFGLALAALALWRRKLASKLRGAILIIPAGLGLVLASYAFAAAEPIVERLYNHSIDPGLAYNMTRGGMFLLVVAGILYLLHQPAENTIDG